MKHNIGVTGTGSLIGQAIIKSIKNSNESNNFKIIGFDYFNDTVGSFWCERHYKLTDIYTNPDLEENWLQEILSHIKEELIEILFIGVDFELELFAKYKNLIEQNTKCKIIISSLDVIKIGNDKYLTYEFLRNNNLYYPVTNLPIDVNFDKIDYPVIVKPRVGARSRGVFKVDNKEELVSKIKIIENPIIQEYIGSESTEYTCGIIYLDGELKASIALNRTLKEGNTYISEHSNKTDKIIMDYISEIANKLKPYGSCNLQLRVDSKGVPKLFEINPRHSGTTYIRSLFGFNEILYIINYIIEGKETELVLKEGRAIRFFDEKLIK
jgi:carbamoyl-phosphate synthase large subunit